MTKKRSWREHAVDHVRATGRCPGEVPATGLPTDLMTKDEFDLTLGSGTHSHERCTHYRSEALGMQVPEDLVELPGFGAAPVTNVDLKRGDEALSGAGPSAIVDRFKRELHTYVDLIDLRESGKLFIPQQILKLETFLQRFFEVKP